MLHINTHTHGRCATGQRECDEGGGGVSLLIAQSRDAAAYVEHALLLLLLHDVHVLTVHALAPVRNGAGGDARATVVTR